MTKSRSIHEIFDECVELLIQGESIDECLRRFPEYTEELRGLLETASVARKSVTVRPSAEFRERARAQLQTALREQVAKPQHAGFHWDWQPRWAIATASALMLVVLGSGSVLAANNSMPDQPLYAVKQATEWFRLAVTTSPTAKAELNATLADRRVNEIVYLASKGNSEELLDATAKLNSNLVQITNLTSSAEKATLASGRGNATGMTVPSTTAQSGTGSNDSQMTSEASPPVTITAPESSPPVYSAATQPNEKAWNTIVVAVPPGMSNVELGRVKLKARLEYLAAKHPTLLREALANVSEENRAALLQAIAVSETGYEIVLQSMESVP